MSEYVFKYKNTDVTYDLSHLKESTTMIHQNKWRHTLHKEWLASKHEVHPSLNDLYFNKSGFTKDTWMEKFKESKMEEEYTIDEEAFEEVLDFILSEM